MEEQGEPEPQDDPREEHGFIELGLITVALIVLFANALIRLIAAN